MDESIFILSSKLLEEKAPEMYRSFTDPRNHANLSSYRWECFLDVDPKTLSFLVKYLQEDVFLYITRDDGDISYGGYIMLHHQATTFGLNYLARLADGVLHGLIQEPVDEADFYRRVQDIEHSLEAE